MLYDMPIEKFHVDCYDARDENLLEYVTVVADKFSPDFVFETDGTPIAVDSQVSSIFKRRYNNGDLGVRFSYED